MFEYLLHEDQFDVCAVSEVKDAHLLGTLIQDVVRSGAKPEADGTVIGFLSGKGRFAFGTADQIASRIAHAALQGKVWALKTLAWLGEEQGPGVHTLVQRICRFSGPLGRLFGLFRTKAFPRLDLRNNMALWGAAAPVMAENSHQFGSPTVLTLLEARRLHELLNSEWVALRTWLEDAEKEWQQC